MSFHTKHYWILFFFLSGTHVLYSQTLKPIPYNNPGLVVDLGVGLWAWPLPMDYDKDGDYDLVVSCPDKPYNGIYFFENVEGDVEMPVFKPGKRLSPSGRNLQLSVVEGEPKILGPGVFYADFLQNQLTEAVNIPVEFDFKKLHPRSRANQWKYVDFDGDGLLDISIGIGDWTEYGWDNAYDSSGVWTNGPLHGYVYIALNKGTHQKPAYEEPQKLIAGEAPIDVYGMPSPSFADFDGDGDLDIICGEFLDSFTYFKNVGTRMQPRYELGRKLQWRGEAIHMDLQMITPVSIDWNKDGHEDLIVGDEDGRVAFVKNTGELEEGIPVFLPPQYFQQEARDVKFGALVTPVSVDWDNDGDEDLVCGNTAGNIGFIENLDGANPPKWAAPVLLKADGDIIRPMAGKNGSIQGPCEAKWGYTTISVKDWDHDGLLDIIANSIWGKVVWYENVGTPTKPLLTSARPIEVEWEESPPKPSWNWWKPQGRELVSQWRTTPCVVDWNQDGLNDLVMLDHEGYLVYFERMKVGSNYRLAPPQRIFVGEEVSVFDRKNIPQQSEALQALQLNNGVAGRSGRRKLCIVDWDMDGRMDVLVNSVNVSFFKNVSDIPGGKVVLKDMGPLHKHELAGHTTSPTVVDWDKDGSPDLLIGAEDGRFYFLKNQLVSK